jgi:excinuclease ABC subunit C
MTSQDFKKLNLPDNPGIYLFKNEEGEILYIGRATSLCDRVKSYFANDLIYTRGMLLVDMVARSRTIEYIETDSVLEAIILEANEIKKHQPYFNTKEKDNKSWNYVVITDEEFPRVVIIRGRTLENLKEELLKFKIKYKFGPYTHNSLLREALRIVRKIFPFRDAKSIMPHQERFYRSLGLSPDTSTPEAKKEYQKTIRNLALFFQGKKHELMRTLEKEMKEYAKNQQFEKAEEIKKTLYALMHIQDISLVKTENRLMDERGPASFRIESYDIAHMSGKNNVGVMTVACDGEIEKSEYRKFKISKEVNDDTAAIREVLLRRLAHPEWQMPNLIVIDGGLGQKNAAEAVLRENNIDIPVVSVVKDNKHKAHHFLGDEGIVQIHKDILLKLNAEAHRFAIAYHKNLRKRTFLQR